MKNLMLMLMVVGMAIMSTGCANKMRIAPIEKVTYEKEAQSENISVFNVKVDVVNGRSLFRTEDARQSSTAILEVVARDTLKKGAKYFAIWAPYRISNYKGSTINTFQDFENQCIEGNLKAIGSMVDVFGVNENACGLASMANPNQAFMDYVAFKEKPDDILVWDAEKLLSELDEKDLLNTDGWYNMVKERKGFMKAGSDQWFGGGYSKWVSVQRTRQ